MKRTVEEKFISLDYSKKYENQGENCIEIEKKNFKNFPQELSGVFIAIKKTSSNKESGVVPAIIYANEKEIKIFSSNSKKGSIKFYPNAKYLPEDCENDLTTAFERLGMESFFEIKNNNFTFSKELFMASTLTESLNESLPKEINARYSFLGNLFLAEIAKRGCLGKKDFSAASKHYGDSCWISIQGLEPETEEMAIGCYFNGLERLRGFEQLYGKRGTKNSPYKKNVVEALSMLELAKDWKYKKNGLLFKLGYSKKEIQDAYEECKKAIKEKYPNAEYISVFAGKYIVALGENSNQVMNFLNDDEVRRYVTENADQTYGDLDHSVKFVLSTKTWETIYGDSGSDEAEKEEKDNAEDLECHGDHWDSISDTSTSEFINLFRKSIEKGTLYGDNKTSYKIEELDSNSGMVFMFEYKEKKSFPVAIRSIVCSGGDSNIAVSGYPVLKDGNKARIAITKINEWQNKLEAIIEGEFDNGRSIAFFDADYALNKKNYKIGNAYDFILGAISYFAEEPKDKGFEVAGKKALEFLKAFDRSPEYDENGKLKPVYFSTENLCAFLQYGRKSLDDAEYVTTVKKIKKACAYGNEFYVYKVRIRFEDEDYFEIPCVQKITDKIKDLDNTRQLQGALWLTGYLAREGKA